MHPSIKEQAGIRLPMIPAFSVFLLKKSFLLLFNSDSALLTYFNAGFAAETFVFVYCYSLTVLKFVNFGRTYVNAFAVAVTFVGINSDNVAHSVTLQKIDFFSH